MLNYKRAQIGQTMTWIVATIIIVLSLTFFVYFANMLAQGGAIKNAFSTAFSDVDFNLDEWSRAKTELAFTRKTGNSERINKWIEKLKEKDE